MGIPYSKQINAAFDQVTPLVASGFQVLETTKNIAVLLAFIEVFIFILLGLILIALFILLVTVNPDLEEERRELVTPMVKWTLKMIHQQVKHAKRNGIMLVVMVTLLISGLTFIYCPFLRRKLNIRMGNDIQEENDTLGMGVDVADETQDLDEEKDSNSKK
jgi:hypothetical protein